MSVLTKLVHINADKKNFFRFNILLKKRVSRTKIKIKNLINKKDFTIGLFSNDQSCIFSFNSPGFRY